MMNALIALGLGIIVFALIVATGLVIISNFGTATAGCASGYTYNYDATNETAYTDNNCCLNGGSDCSSVGNFTTATDSAVSTTTIMGYMQNNLITWIPAIIALGVGLLFIGALMGKNKRNY